LVSRLLELNACSRNRAQDGSLTIMLTVEESNAAFVAASEALKTASALVVSLQA
jgi:hypothetical protein